MSTLEKIESKVIDLIDVQQDIVGIIQKLREENRDLKEKMDVLEQEKEQMDQRLEKILMTIQEVGEFVAENSHHTTPATPETQYS